MKKILFIIDNFEIGGIQKSLIELLGAIHDLYDITVLCIDYKLENRYLLPQSIKVIEGNKYLKMTVMDKERYHNQYGICALALKFFFTMFSKYISKTIAKKTICKLAGIIEGEYDVAISYSHPVPGRSIFHIENEVLINSVRASKKVSFLHCDYLAYNNNTNYNRYLYDKIDRVAAVSQSVKDVFVSALPEMKEKTVVIYNVCNSDNVKKLADFEEHVYQKTALVTLARLSKEKGIVRCLPIVKQLISEGLDFEWHIVGSGAEDEVIRNQIEALSLSQVVYLEGQKNNPYPFLKHAKYLFIPSYHEAAPMVINEALSLNVPILSTATLSAKELITDRGIGIVCDNNDDAIFLMLKNALRNPYSIQDPDLEDFNNMAIRQFNSLIQ